jgi:phosphotransferase system  glucose/maltose/N-acetylglucosamine-specific IIC component
MINSMPIYNGDGQLIAHWYQLAPNGSQSQIVGDLNIQIYLTQLIGKKVHLGSATGVSHVLTIQDVINSLDKTNNVLLAPGQYTNFAYVFNMFGYPGAAAGMLLAAPKGDARKQAISIVVPGTIVSTLTGTSEAIEFTFLFLAP